MGLAISYTLALADASPEEARRRIVALHRGAAQLGLPQLGPLIELQGEGICRTDADDPLLCVKQGAMSVEDYDAFFRNCKAIPSCRQLMGFTAFPGEGCHHCSFGLAIHAEGSQQWQWYDFCKTQYASSPECGGLANLIRCHHRVLALLDLCEELSILASACDPSGYRDHRNLDQLVSCVNDANVFTAAAIGGLKDGLETLGYSAEAPILERADFEHLEAQGRLQTPPTASAN
ncbi:MAG: hypothetical protein ACNA8O_03485 [Cyanobacteriota bacterium]